MSARQGRYPAQMTFQQRTVHVGQPVDTGKGEELAEAGQGIHPRLRRRDAQAGGQSQTHPPLAELTQPELGDAVEPKDGTWTGSAGRGAAGQLVQTPDVPGILGLPSGPVPQRLDGVAGLEQEQHCSDRSNNELTPAVFACRTARITMRGGMVRARASCRHCSAY